MNPWLALLIGLVAGVAVASLVVIAWRGRGRSRAALRREATRIHPQVGQLMAVLRSGAVIVGDHDEVSMSNVQARTWGLVRGDRIGLPEVLDEVREARRFDRSTTRDVEVKRGAASPSMHLTIRVAPLENGAMIVLAEDRTPLMRVDETRRDFVTNVSHELKTPIGAIGLLSEAVHDAADDPEAVKHFADRLQFESGRLAELVRQIIDLSRLQSDDPLLAAQPVTVGSLAQTARDRCQQLAQTKKMRVLISGRGDLQVLGDEGQLAEAVTNLVQNAIAYSDEQSRVVISHRLVRDPDGDLVEIAVADNGVGIKPEDQQRIFERFYRVDYGRSRGQGGTGLGLSIVKHIAAVHAGTVHVWSQPGQGSTFTLRFPVHVPAHDDSAPHSAAAMTSASGPTVGGSDEGADSVNLPAQRDPHPGRIDERKARA